MRRGDETLNGTENRIKKRKEQRQDLNMDNETEMGLLGEQETRLFTSKRE